MCSADLGEFIEKYHLDLSVDGKFNARAAFGSHDDADHVYNTPGLVPAAVILTPRTKNGMVRWRIIRRSPMICPGVWCRRKKITIEDVKYALSAHFQGTPYDPYAAYGDDSMRGAYRSIGINRNDFRR